MINFHKPLKKSCARGMITTNEADMTEHVSCHLGTSDLCYMVSNCTRVPLEKHEQQRGGSHDGPLEKSGQPLD